jgi:ribosomal protein S18 acetylase RimI-like enzyme
MRQPTELLKNLSFRPAKMTDIPRIVELVNAASRGDSGKQGWTTEADLLDGQRTDAEEITGIIQADDSMVLLCELDGMLVASIQLENNSLGAYLGMLAVNPLMQNQGIGKRLLAEAEGIAQQTWAAEKMQMVVITLRHDIIAFYERPYTIVNSDLSWRLLFIL